MRRTPSGDGLGTKTRGSERIWRPTRWFDIQRSHMSNEIRGRFYFERTSNGHLLGEFSNRQSDLIYTESADLIGQSDGFMGNYSTTWQENGNPCHAELAISNCPRNPRLLVIKWSRNGKPVFEGEGMFCDDILIGDYQNV
jgi:hypothetical protein